jgi:nitrogenase-stabilizing/protective protein
MTDTTLTEDLESLSSAEEFLEYFEVPYDPALVRVKRLHILQRFHDYLEDPSLERSGEAFDWSDYRALLMQAYADLVGIEAREAKLFRVFQRGDGSSQSVSLDTLTASLRRHAS